METKEMPMNFERVLALCRNLAGSQGLYGRLYHTLLDATDQQKEQVNKAVKNFHDDIDIILWIEG